MERRGGIAVPRWSTHEVQYVQHPFNDLLAQAKIAWVNWESPELRPRDAGGYGVIYSVAPGLVAKIGLIEVGLGSAQK